MVSKLTSLNSSQPPVATRQRQKNDGWLLTAVLFFLMTFSGLQQAQAQCDLNVFGVPGPPPFAEVTLQLGPDGLATVTQDSLIGLINPTGPGCSLYFYDWPGQAVFLGDSVVFSCDNSTAFTDGMSLFVVSDDDGVPGGNESAPFRLRVLLEDNIPPSIGGGSCGSTVLENVRPTLCRALVNFTPPVLTENCYDATTTLTISYAMGSPAPTSLPTPNPESYIGSDIQDSVAAWAANGFQRWFHSSAVNNLGRTEVTFSLEDSNNPPAVSCTVSVLVIDDEDPSITCPADLTVSTDMGSCDVTNIPGISVSTGDNCGIISVEYRLSGSTSTPWTSGSNAGVETFNLGLNTVSYRIRDAAGNTNDCSFDVTVTDQTDPVITCPADTTIFLNGPCDVTVSWTEPVPTDNCSASGDITVSSSHDPGDTFPVGTTTVTYNAIDEAGNASSCSFDINVMDTSMVTVTCPADQTLGTICADAEVPDYTSLASASSSCGSIMGLMQSPSPGTLLGSIGGLTPADAETFTVTLTDPGSMASCTFMVTLNDNDVPIPDVFGVNLPQIDEECASSLVIDAPTATDYDCVAMTSVTIFGVPSIGMLVPMSSPPQYTIPAGNWNITWTYEDTDLKTTNQFQIVNVGTDNVNPQLSAIDSLFINLDANGNASISEADLFIVASDNCGLSDTLIAPFTFDCDDIGPNNVAITVLDDSFNPATVITVVTVRDQIDPVLIGIPVDATVDCDAIPAPPIIGTDIMAMDNCDIPGIGFSEISNRSFNPAFCNDYNYNITRSWTATDASGNTTTFSQTLTVQDTTRPVFNLISTINAETDPNDCATTISYSVTADSLSDNCAAFANLAVSYSINGGASVMSSSFNEGFAQGTHTVVFTASDPCGNTNTHTLTINVADTTPPIASCLGGAPTVALPPSGILVLPPSFIDNGSFDECDGINLMRTISQDTFRCDQADGITAWPITLTVTDQSGNSATCNAAVIIQDNIDPVASCVSNLTVQLDGNGMGSITPAMVDNGSSDNCTDAGDLLFSLSQSSFDVTDIALSPINVNMTVTDENGNTDVCTVSVTVELPETCLNVIADPPTIVSGTAATIVSVPVLVNNFINVESLQFRAIIERDTVAEFTGLTADALAAGGFVTNIISSDTMNITWINMGGSPPVTLADGSVIFNLEVRLIGDVLETSRIRLIGDVAVPGLITRNYAGTPFQQSLCADDGFVFISTAAQLEIAGEIRMENGNMVSLADVQLVNETTGFPVGTMTTDATGMFSFNPVSAGIDYSLNVTKDINWINGVSALDLSLIQRHIVGIDTFTTPYQKIAADALPDNSITVFDVVQLNRLLATSIPGPPIPPTGNTSWRFVPADFVFPDTIRRVVPVFPTDITIDMLAADSLNNDFIAVKVGDVENNANPLALTGNNSGPDDRSGSKMTLATPQQSLTAGEEYQLEFTTEGFENLLAYQWVLEFDPQVISFVDAQGSAISSLKDNHFNLHAIDQGKLVMIWYEVQPETMTDGDALFTISVRANKDVEKLSEALRVSSERLVATAFTEQGDAMDVELNFTGEIAAPVTASFELFQNRPNPFKEETIISFTLPEASTARLSVMDVSGRVLKVYQGQYAKGYNEVSIQRDELPVEGVLFYQLDTPDATAVKKMVVLK
ncbi:MAG: HYR domain-containing protein [Bacteroidota bacterium]